MCTQPPTNPTKDTTGTIKSKRTEKKELRTQKKVASQDEVLRQQVRQTLWQAAISGKLESAFPKVIQSRIKPFEAPSSETSTALQDVSAESSLGESTSNSAQVEVDVEQLRRRARESFLKAIVSGKLNKVMAKPTEQTDESSKPADDTSDATDIRTKVRATLEKACYNGRLQEALIGNQATKADVQKCREQPARIEDTRDLDALLLEIGEDDTSKPAKSKKKSKKGCRVCDLPKRSLSCKDSPTQPEDWQPGQLAAVGPAMEPIIRKAPVAPAPIMEPIAQLHQQHLTQAVDAVKVQILPAVQPPLHGGAVPLGSIRSIPIWPGTPESTPPSSPRNDCGGEEEQEEVLVPVPIYLLAEVKQLLAAGLHRKGYPGLTQSACCQQL